MICRILVGLFVLAWLAGIGMFAALEWGGVSSGTLDLLTALVMTPLGLPWNLIAMAVAGKTAKMIIALLAPVVNLAILAGLCAFIRRRLRPAAI
jgi:hypothetical protein